MSRLDEKLAALASMTPHQIRREWQQQFKAPAPELGHRLLSLSIAHRLQEKAKGGLPAKLTREIDGMIRKLEKDGEVKAPSTPTLRPGTQLVREWRGVTYRVLVLDDCLLFRDQRFHSLTEVTRVITGTHWSGPRFFGLVKAKREARK